MSPQRRTALVSVVAAVALMAIKLGTGLASGSLGLVSEALHSGTDLVAALLTLFAIGYAGKPADRAHPYGHGKAEHLAALAEAATLALVSLAVGALAVARVAGCDRDHDRRRVVGVRSRSRSCSRSTPRAPSCRSSRRAATAALRCRRMRCISPATSSARSPCSPVSSPYVWAGRPATRSPRSLLHCSCSALRVA